MTGAGRTLDFKREAFVLAVTSADIIRAMPLRDCGDVLRRDATLGVPGTTPGASSTAPEPAERAQKGRRDRHTARAPHPGREGPQDEGHCDK